MTRHKKWVPIEQAVKHIMAAKKCTRDEAMNLLAFAVEGKKVKARKTPKASDSYTLSPDEAAAMFAAQSERAFFGLGYFINVFRFSPEDIRLELASGRLVARTSADAHFSTLLGEQMPADQFEITAKALHEWMDNPQTPPRLIAQMVETMNRPDFGKLDQPCVLVDARAPGRKQ